MHLTVIQAAFPQLQSIKKPASEQDHIDTMWAMLFTVLGSFFCSGGLILMKKSHNRAELAERNNIKRNAYCDVFWLGGFASIVLGSLFNVVALGYGNVLLLASSSSLSIIFNTVFSVTLLNEKLVKKDILAMLFICIGSILFLIIAKNDPEEYTPKSLLDLITRPISIAYMALQLIYIIGAYKVVQAINKRIFNFITHISTDDEKEQVKESSKPSVKVMCTSLELVKRKIFNKISTNHNFQNLKRDIKTPMALMSIAAGVVAGLASALLKGMTISVSTTGFLSLSTICYLTIAIALSLFQLHLINIPMKSYDQIEIIPIYQTFLILLNMASGAIILNEQKMYKWYELVNLCLCAIICICGVVMIVQKPPSTSQSSSKSSSVQQKTEKVAEPSRITPSINDEGDLEAASAVDENDCVVVPLVKSVESFICVHGHRKCGCLRDQQDLSRYLDHVEANERIQILQVVRLIHKKYSMDYHNQQESTLNSY